jgi:VanZ family protein
MLWSLAVICMSGDLGSGENTLGIIRWLLSRLVPLEPAQLNLINFSVRKTGHALAYGLMYVLWFRAFLRHANYRPWHACLWSLGCCLFFASTDEVRQSFYASRGPSLYDVFLDMSGGGLAALLTGAVWTPGSKTAVTSGRAENQNLGLE